MIHERHLSGLPGSRRLIENKRTSVSRAAAVAVVSTYTKMQVEEAFPFLIGRVFVTPLAATYQAPDSDMERSLRAQRPFLLFVGNRDGYKNFEVVLDALASREELNELELVAFGGGSPTSAEKVALTECGLQNRVRFVSGNDSALAAHYATALALVYPSFDEGFGLPPLEAMLHGCPVLAARAGAIPEVVADAALLFDPANSDELGELMTEVSSGGDSLHQLRAAGYGRVQDFSWERTAAATLEMYREVAGS